MVLHLVCSQMSKKYICNLKFATSKVQPFLVLIRNYQEFEEP